MGIANFFFKPNQIHQAIGKVVLVTGSNTGIGKATALELVKRRAERVILACRNVKSGEQAANEIRKQCPESKTTIAVRQLDLSSNESVRHFASEILATEPALHVLINNAGILGPSKRTLSVDGNELTFQTNHLGHFLLTNLLLDRLKRSAPSRIINVTSHWYIFWLYARYIHLLDDPNLEKPTSKYHWMGVYAQSKMANILFTRSLHRRLEGSGVTTYCLHPGFIASDISRDFWINKWIDPEKFRSYQTKNCAWGARTSVFCATEPGIEKWSSSYFKNCTVSNPGKIGDEETEQLLWQLSEKLTAPKKG